MKNPVRNYYQGDYHSQFEGKFGSPNEHCATGVGKSGFNKIMYKGKPLVDDKSFDGLADVVDASVATMTVSHFYRGISMFGMKSKHDCLGLGYWCWRNALERPDKAVKYLLKRKK